MINANFVLAHNDCDKEYYEGLLNVNCYINPTLMIEDPIGYINQPSIRRGTIIGGNLVRWYGGFNSLIVAQTIDEKIYAPRMGRMQELELQLDSIEHLPYMQWNQWIHELNKFKYAVHMNPNSIGGTFSLNCAYLGIPCIGNINSNTQRICFPDISVNPDDLKSAKRLIKQLNYDESFYNEVSEKAIQLYKEHFSENNYVNVWNEILNKI
jgi:hypothetical protein